ncbi:MAG: HEAT repeat domain-containing protein, partial [Alphaproteobacteria bacterium]
CPWNKFAHASDEPALRPRQALAAPRLAELAALDDARFRTLFSRSAVKRLGRDRFVRNVAIAIGNSGQPALAPSVVALLGDPSALVRAMAVWALSRLLPGDAFATLRAARIEAELDPAVRDEWENAS